MIESMLLEAVQLAREGRTVEARWLVQEVLRRDRSNETAWLLMADCAETREESIMALESCLRHVPNAPRARVGLDILRSEGHNYRRGGLLTDRLNLAVKNVKSQPRKRLEDVPGKSAVDVDGLEKLRQELPAGWVPLPEEKPSKKRAARKRAKAAQAVSQPPAEASALDLIEAEPAPEDLLAAAVEVPRSQREAGFWQPAGDPAPAPLAEEPVEAFLVSPDLFTPEELSELEEALGAVPVARRRVSIFEDPAEAWKSLSEAELPDVHRIARAKPRGERLPVGRVLLYALLAALITCLAAVLLFLAAYLLRGV